MIYQLLRIIVKISLFVFFKNIVITGKNNIPDEGPLIIVANHPNTFMDPLLIASITNQRIGFVANAGIFSNKILAAILRYFHVIPIYRKKDIKPGEKPDNREAFVKCHEYLGEGNTLLIFPEGNSYYELKLRDIKTGAARIALSFEALRNFESNLKILPVTLDYSDSIQFRSMISITIDSPIFIQDYKEAYKQDEIESVNVLSEEIRKALIKNIPHTTGKEQEDFLIKVHRFYTAYYKPDADLYSNPKRSLVLRSQLSKALNYTHKNNGELYHDIQAGVQAFFSILKSEKLTTGFFTDGFLNKNPFMVNLGYFLKFILLLPIYIYGLLVNYLPYILPSRIFKILKLDIEFRTPVELVVGMITFPAFYAWEIWLFRKYVSDEFLHSSLLFFSFVISGYAAMYYFTEIKRFTRVMNFYFFMNPGNKLKLLELRDEILKKIEVARSGLS